MGDGDTPMKRAGTPAAWTALDTLLTMGTLGDLSDGELLDHFRRNPETTGQEAFRILVGRHGAMVLGVCRSLVRDPHEAEDAFQATFLVLVRRAESIRQRETIAPWLYGVACRVARRARIRSARRRKQEVTAEVEVASRDDASVEVSGTDQTLQEEIRRLPESLRAPLILCCLEGQSYDLAARRLGLRESTLRGRLHRARKRLESRLRRRGVLAPVVARLVESEKIVLPSLPSSLVEATTQFALRWSTLSGLLVGAEAVPGSIAALAQGVINAMLIQTVKICGLATILTVGVIGTAVVGQQGKTGAHPPASATSAGAPPSQNTAAPNAGNREIPIATKTEQILRKLDQNIELELPNVVPIDQFLKAIKRATTDATFSGIPIYVDPMGLQEVKNDLNTRVEYYKSGRLGLVIRQTLRQADLSYVVKDGFLMISSRADITDQRLDELDRKLDRLLRMMERLDQAKGDTSPNGRK
jgi:RNA polymerase sigma factor (sigma-70 family)